VRLALGTVQFGTNYGVANAGGQVPVDEVRRILGYARDHGIDMLDTAIAYGDSESRLGSIGVASWRVVSKLPSLPEGCPDVAAWVRTSVRGSLNRLGVSRLYAVLLHRPEELLTAGGDALYRALQALKSEGLVRRIGISIYEPAELDAIVARFPVDVVQAPFNILDRRLLEAGWLARLKAQGAELHVRSVFLQGLLLMPAGQRPRKFERWQSLWDGWHGWLAQAGVTPLQACVRYVMRFAEIDAAVVGVDSLAQLAQIVQSGDGELPAVPTSLGCVDADLLNPARWNALA
jgi:aryl-alcohol dehydrogenase-like predicted oxidoreductase